MVRPNWMLAALLCGLGSQAANAGAPDFTWRVLTMMPGIVTMVSDPVRGPIEARIVGTLVVSARPDTNGNDNSTHWWSVDCTAHTIADAAQPRRGSTYEGQFLQSQIADFACTGARRSDDPASFAGDGEAIVYARTLAAKIRLSAPRRAD